MIFKDIRGLLSISILLIFSLALVACDKRPAVGIAENQSSKADYLDYQNEGLSFSYPEHWKLKLDEAPDFSSDLAVVFDASELSRVTVLVDQGLQRTIDSIANHYESRLKLKQNEHVKSFQRSPIVLAGKKGVRLAWQESEFFERKVALSIFRVLDTPAAVFLIVDIDEEDVASETPHIVSLLESISLN